MNHLLLLALIPLDVIGLHGPLGSSKTWGSVLITWLKQKQGYKVWAGMELNRDYFPDYKNLDRDPEINWDYLMECADKRIPFPYEKIVLLFDEFQYQSDSRFSGSMKNILLSWLFVQSRKRGVIIILTSKKMRYIELRDREDEDIVIRCYKRHNTPDLPEKNWKLCFKHNCELRHFFVWKMLDVQNHLSKRVVWWKPEFVFPMYDTKELNTMGSVPYDGLPRGS